MIELNTKDGNNLLIYSGLIPLDLASFFDKNKPKNNANEIKNPYHLMYIGPTFKSSEPGDFKKA